MRMGTNARDQWLAPKQLAANFTSTSARSIGRSSAANYRRSAFPDGGAIRIHRSALNPNESNGGR